MARAQRNQSAILIGGSYRSVAIQGPRGRGKDCRGRAQGRPAGLIDCCSPPRPRRVTTRTSDFSPPGRGKLATASTPPGDDQDSAAQLFRMTGLRDCGDSTWPQRARGTRNWIALVPRVRRVGRVLLNLANEIKRGMKRFIVLGIRRDIRLRAGLLVPSCLEMAAQ